MAILRETSDAFLFANSRLGIRLSRAGGFIAPAGIVDADGTAWADAPAPLVLDVRTTDGRIGRARRLRYVTHATRKVGGGTEFSVVTTAEFGPTPADGLAVEVRLVYFLPPDEAWFTEQVRLRVISGGAVALHQVVVGWQLAGRADVGWMPVPFGLGHDSNAPTLLTDEGSGRLLARDGAIFFDAQGRNLLVAKTPSDRDPEYIVVESWKNQLKFSGFRAELAWNDCPAWLVDGVYESSPTRFERVDGPVERAFTAHRRFMAAHGIARPADYAPPLNYCIYYECGGNWPLEKTAALIEVAADLGCTLLYTDQGWETTFGSGLWDEDRLGRCEDFVARAATRGLDVGVLIGLHGGTLAWPAEVCRRRPDGAIEDGDQWHPVGICAGSGEWAREKTSRLVRIAAAGVRFFSFDFNDDKGYAGPTFRRYPCFARNHEHGWPMTSWEHVRAVAAQQRVVRERCPEVLVEAHDWALAGDSSLPMYLFPASAQERWGFEYMWNPFADFVEGRLQNLFFYALAYDRPLYLHMDLAKDNEHLVAFWFLASTVRHLGIGNFTALDGAQQARVRHALAEYRSRREFFTHGVFFGSTPRVHVHAIPGRGVQVMFFNETSSPLDVSAHFSPDDLGLPEEGKWDSETWLGDTVRAERRNGGVALTATVAAHGVAAIGINP